MRRSACHLSWGPRFPDFSLCGACGHSQAVALGECGALLVPSRGLPPGAIERKFSLWGGSQWVASLHVTSASHSEWEGLRIRTQAPAAPRGLSQCARAKVLGQAGPRAPPDRQSQVEAWTEGVIWARGHHTGMMVTLAVRGVEDRAGLRWVSSGVARSTGTGRGHGPAPGFVL